MACIKSTINCQSLVSTWKYQPEHLLFGKAPLRITMPLPLPEVPLQDPCTAIYNGKLYAYQPDAFQALDLKEGGTWSRLSMGTPVNGSTCVQGTIEGKNSFILVGGSTTTHDYHGLQHYDFAADKWISDKPLDGVAVNRQHHGAAFLPQSSSILIYAGFQDGTVMPSTQTFIIHTQPPYDVEAFESNTPPVIDPLMLSYNTSHALMLGGDPSNTKISTFSPKDGWQQMNVTLEHGLRDSSKVQAAIWTGSGGSKVLELFDMSVTPNKLTTIVLTNGTNSTWATKTPRSYPRSSHHRPRRRKREMSLADRPAYNSSGAPQNERTGFSLSTDPATGLVVAAGGDSQQPLAMFNQTSNQWIDVGQFFGPKSIPTATSTPVPSTSATISSSPTATTAPAAANNHARNQSLTILGAVLGGVLGAAVLLVMALLLLRLYRKRRDRRRELGKAEYAMDTKQDPMDFSDIGAPYMTEAGGSASRSPDPAHSRSKSERSIDPKAIDRNVTASSESRRALLHAKGDSTGSSKSFWARAGKSGDRSPPPQISAPIMGPSLSRTLLSPESRNDARAETGWSRYFTTNNSREVLSNMQNPQQDHSTDPRPATYLSSSRTQSDYASSNPHESAEVEPLNFNGSHVLQPSGAGITSPNNSRPGLGLAITQGSSPDRDREKTPDTPSTPVSNLSETDDPHNYSHESEGHDSWTPVGAAGERNSNWTDERPISSLHSSRLYAHPGERVEIPNFPMPSSARNSTAPSPKAKSAQVELSSPSQPPMIKSPHFPDQPGLRNVITKDLIRTKSGRLQATGELRTGTQRIKPATNTVAVGNSPVTSASDQPYSSFPRPKEQAVTPSGGGQEIEDMSWLNLGTSSEQQDKNAYFSGR